MSVLTRSESLALAAHPWRISIAMQLPKVFLQNDKLIKIALLLLLEGGASHPPMAEYDFGRAVRVRLHR